MAIGDSIRTMIRGMKMLDAGKSQQEVRTYMESRGATNIKFSQPQTVDVTASTMNNKKYASAMNNKKYASIGTSQMRSGRRSTIKTSSTGLTSKIKTSKKTLLGE